MFDLAVIGGGVNGAGIARDAAGPRTESVCWSSRAIWLARTSSASTKLIHGGLRYLEHYEFRLVREALAEREVLLRAAPHIVWPLRFVLPHHAGLRPWWLVRLGLFLYDHLGGRKILPPSRSIDLRTDPVGAPLRADYTRGVRIFRLLGGRCAAGGAVGARCREPWRRHPHPHALRRCARRRWRVAPAARTTARTCAARALVNAAGPWVSQVLSEVLGHAAPTRVRLVKGSHIVVQRLFDARPLLHLPEPRRARLTSRFPTSRISP